MIRTAPSEAAEAPLSSRNARTVRASPAVRRRAREFGVDLAHVRASGPNERITHADVLACIRDAMRTGVMPGVAPQPPRTTLSLAAWPDLEPGRFGPVESVTRSPHELLHACEMARDRVQIPQVTSFDEADITELEAFRQRILVQRGAADTDLPRLAFVIRACADALRRFPDFNASLDGEPGGGQLLLKRGLHIGFTAFTDQGAQVAVVRDVDCLTLSGIAARITSLSQAARDGRLSAEDQSGAGFTVCDLGTLGGTRFTPAIRAPEVALLGTSRSELRPVWNGCAFSARTILPLCLSWDHRVIDGVLAARFLVQLAQDLSDFRKMLL